MRLARLVRLFPASWRQRYGEEFEALLEEATLSPRDVVDLLHGVWDAHVRPQPHLVPGGPAMAANLTRGLWSAAAALGALVLMTVGQSVVTAAILRRAAGLDPSLVLMAGLAAILGAAAVGLWRWGRLPVLRILLALLALRSLQLGLTGLVLDWSDGPLTALYWQIDPLGLGWLPPTLFNVAAGVALVAALARWLRLRVATALVVGLTLELLVGSSDLSLISFLRLHGLEQALMFVSPTGPGEPGQVGRAVLSPTSYLAFVGPVIWAVVLQQVALRPAGAGAPQPLARAYVAFVRAHWMPVAALAFAVIVLRFPVPAYLTSASFQNPVQFAPTGTDVPAQFRDCLRAYGVVLPAGASTKTAAIPAGPATRCSYIINSYPAQARGRPLAVPGPVTAAGVTYTVTSVQLAGTLLKIDWNASGRPVDDLAAFVYPARPPADSNAVANRFMTFEWQYLESAMLDSAGSRVGGRGGGGELTRTRPSAWRGETIEYVSGPGQYSLTFGCADPVQLPTGKGSPGPECTGPPNATITIVVT